MSDAAAPILELRRVEKRYGAHGAELQVLRGLDVVVERGAYVAIVGASGSGKSTLLNILGCLDRPSSGEYRLEGVDVSQLPDERLSEIRNRRIGFVFQSFHLIPQLSILENVEVPLQYMRVPRAERTARAAAVLRAVGLGHRLDHRPCELSGGECQRAAIARALVNDPVLLLADEPTGNLDSKTGAEILALFAELHRAGRTIVLITHDPEVAARAGRVIRIKDGAIVAEEGPVAPDPVALEAAVA